MSFPLRPVPKPAPRPKKAKRPLPKVNSVRAAKREERDFGPKGDWIRLQACCVLGKRTGDWVTDKLTGERVQVVIVAAHFPSRGAGGRAEHLVPLAWHLHQQAHDDEREVQVFYGVRFKALAKMYEQRWQREQARRAP